MFDSVIARNTSLSSLGTSIRNVHPLVTLDVEAGCSESSSFNHWMGFILVSSAVVRHRKPALVAMAEYHWSASRA